MSTTVWIGVAAGLSVVALLGLAATATAIFTVWRLRRDRWVIEAAERHELVDLTTVVKRYVPGDLQSNRPADEIPVARDVIIARLPYWRRLTVVFAGVNTVQRRGGTVPGAPEPAGRRGGPGGAEATA